MLDRKQMIARMFDQLVEALCRDGKAGKALFVAQIATGSKSCYLLTKRQVDTCVRACIRNRELEHAANIVTLFYPSKRAEEQFVRALIAGNKAVNSSRKTSRAISSYINSLIETQQYEKARSAAKLLGRRPLSKAREKHLNDEFVERMF